MKTRNLSLRFLVAAALPCALAACVSSPTDILTEKEGSDLVEKKPGTQMPPSTAGKPTFTIDPIDSVANVPGGYSGGQDNTHDHMPELGEGATRDPFEILAQRAEEGPEEVRTRLHSCQKLQIAAVRNVLTSFGVNIDAESPDIPTAGQLLKGGTNALGAANYDARTGEALVWSAAGAAKLFDIFVQAAPEIIANLQTVPQCQVLGQGPAMFEDETTCNRDAVTCLMGRPATDEHLAICQSLVESASDVATGQKIAVATILSAAHSCE